MNSIHTNASRRNFLRQAAALGAATGTPFALNLSLIGAAAAQSATDHKALVCIFLNGGMDQSNAVVPYQGAEYNAYYAARPALARSQASLLPISPLGYGGPRLALASELAGLKTLFDQGQCAVMANVGLLTQPTSMAQFKLGTVRPPAGLYSHSDQSGSWQTGLPDRASATGWLGRVGDLTTAAYKDRKSVV